MASVTAIEQKTIATQTDANSHCDATAQTTFDEDDSSGQIEVEKENYDIIEAAAETELEEDDVNLVSMCKYEMYDGLASDENTCLDEDTETELMHTKQTAADEVNVPVDEIDEIDEIDTGAGIIVNERCSYCNKKFTNASDFQSHVNEHMEILPLILTSANFFRCSRCRLVFATAEQLCAHIDAAELCQTDGKSAANGDNCVDYQFLGDPIMNNIDQIRMFSCQKVEDEGSLLACEFCEFMFESFMDFVEHFNDVHLTNVENTEELYESTANLSHCCGICAKTYMNIKDIMFHVYFHQTTFYCPFVGCSDTYPRSVYLNRHIAREHFTEEKYACEHCAWETSSYAHFKRHVRHECTARKFACPTCGECQRPIRFVLLELLISTSTFQISDSCEKAHF